MLSLGSVAGAVQQQASVAAALAVAISFADGAQDGPITTGDRDRSINEGTPWSFTISVTGGTTPYSIQMVRERPSHPGAGADSITHVSTVTATGATFSSGGAILNTGEYWGVALDDAGFVVASVRLNLTVIAA